MNNTDYFVRQKTIQVSESGFKIVKLYAVPEGSKEHKNERTKVDVSRGIRLENDSSREWLEAIVEGNFKDGCYYFPLNFADNVPDKDKLKAITAYLNNVSYACLSKTGSELKWLRCVERDENGYLNCSLILNIPPAVSAEEIAELWDKGTLPNVQCLERNEDYQYVQLIPESNNECIWTCSPNVKALFVSIEDSVIAIDDLQEFIQAKAGEDTAPVLKRMFPNWNVSASKFSFFEDGSDNMPHIELRLTKFAEREKTLDWSKSTTSVSCSQRQKAARTQRNSALTR